MLLTSRAAPVSSLSTRVDSLEASIGDLMSGTAGGPVPGDADGPPLEDALPLKTSGGSASSGASKA